MPKIFILVLIIVGYVLLCCVPGILSEVFAKKKRLTIRLFLLNPFTHLAFYGVLIVSIGYSLLFYRFSFFLLFAILITLIALLPKRIKEAFSIDKKICIFSLLWGVCVGIMVTAIAWTLLV